MTNRLLTVLLRLALMLIVAGSFLSPQPARADIADRLSAVAALRREVATAKGPFAYVALRRLWAEWERGDPTEVEEALAAIVSDRSIAPPVRAYAGLLEAYARRRRGDLEGARTRIARLGYVSRWALIGPFDNEGKGGIDVAYPPEKELHVPVSTARTYEGKERRSVRWRVLPPVSPYGWLDLGVFLRPTENVCGYALTFVRDARQTQKAGPRPISLWVGSAGAMRVFWNGDEVLRDDKYRALDSDRFAASVTLQDGWNRLLIKACGDEQAPLLSVRVAGADGGPDEHLEIDADPSHSTAEGGAAKTRGGSQVPAPRALEGPIQAFERLVKSGDAAVLEAYARYMVLSRADDTSEHRARELARRAAEKEPTVARLLLAGEVAEDRNQRAIWIERAEARVKKGGVNEADVIATLLARASHTRSGVTDREAAPQYERVLAIDPDNVTAILERVELYEEAGLRETAMALLERALARRPRSVALLRAMVAALRQQMRITEANDVAERYAQLRFDDPTFARAQIELALARRDAPTATRWIERLIATNPDSAGALETAARAHRSLGNHAMAIGMLRRALDLAPEDTDTMRELASTYALAGQRDEQLKLLRKVLELQPQAKDVREYVALSEPAKPRPDEAFARPAAEFLAQRDAPAAGSNQRTLVDLQVTTVFPNGLASRFHQVVFQPLTDAAAAEAREYAFGYESDSEIVQLRGARVYRAGGGIDEAIESGEGPADDPSMSMYTSFRAFYVRFPRLNPGDVVELQYRIEDIAHRNAFADYFGEVKYLQSSDPIGRAEYVLITPKSRTFYFNKPNVPGLESTIEERGDQRIYRFLAKNVPAVEPEANQPPYTEFLGHVHVSTYRTWEEMGKWYWGLVKDQLIPDDEVKRRVAELTKGLTDERAKVKAVYDYVVQKTRYVALEFGIHGYKPYRCAQIFARGFGDCKDKATLIVTMLKELGIPSTLVIVRTGHKGLFEESPASLAPFDHAIAYVPSLDLYLDGTAEYTGSTELPAMDRGAMALQINEGNPKLVHLPDPPPEASVSSTKMEATLAPDGSAVLDWRAEVTGVDAPGWRVRFHAEATRKQRLQQTLASVFPGAEVTSIETSNLEDIEQKVSVRLRAKAPHFARKEDGAHSVQVGPRERFVRDFAPLSRRKLDSRFYAQWTQEHDWTIRLPPGATVKTPPTPSQGKSQFGSYKVDVETGSGTLRVKTTLVFARTRVTAAEYPAFRAWCEQVDRALGQRALITMK